MQNDRNYPMVGSTSISKSHVILHSNARRLRRLQLTTLTDLTQLLCAWRAENFRGLRNFFARVGRKICVIPTLHIFFFFGYACNYDSINSQRRCGVIHSARWPSARNFCARGVPDFRKFCNFFARFLRKICVMSTLNSRVILR